MPRIPQIGTQALNLILPVLLLLFSMNITRVSQFHSHLATLHTTRLRSLVPIPCPVIHMTHITRLETTHIGLSLHLLCCELPTDFGCWTEIIFLHWPDCQSLGDHVVELSDGFYAFDGLQLVVLGGCLVELHVGYTELAEHVAPFALVDLQLLQQLLVDVGERLVLDC